MTRRYLIGGFAGLLVGSGLVHPLSMIFQGVVHPTIDVNVRDLLNAFSVHHMPMALFFGLLFIVIASMSIFYWGLLEREKNRVGVLEGLLPICSYCKKIRDDSVAGHGKGRWYEVEQYISRKTDTDFSHGICDACLEKVLEEIGEVQSPSG